MNKACCLFVGFLAFAMIGCKVEQSPNGTAAKPELGDYDRIYHDGQAPWVKMEERHFAAHLLEIARTYESYGRLFNDARPSPWDCRARLVSDPEPNSESTPLLSRSNDESTHGRKLYSLFVRKSEHYRYTGLPASVTNQVIVKEAWTAEEMKPGEKVQPIVRRLPMRMRSLADETAMIETTDTWLPVAKTKDGKEYRACRKAELFVMFQIDPSTPGTDEGWVYGTVTLDGKNVIEVGRIASCMGCH
jgi:hypothetical protein